MLLLYGLLLYLQVLPSGCDNYLSRFCHEGLIVPWVSQLDVSDSNARIWLGVDRNLKFLEESSMKVSDRHEAAFSSGPMNN